MKYALDKERIYLFAPCVNVCAVATFNKLVIESDLRSAIESVMCQHHILRARIAIDSDGKAYYEARDEAPSVMIESYDCEPVQLIARQENIPFNAQTGDMIRFCCRDKAERTELTVVMHHLLGDGNSLMLLMRDILQTLNGRKVDELPIHPLSYDDLPAHTGLPLPMRIMMNLTNRRWQKSGRVFSAEDYIRMQKRYAAMHNNVLCVREIADKQLEALIQNAHTHGVTVNSLLASAFSAEIPTGEGIGVAVDSRPQHINCMGNYATGISVKATYNNIKSLFENAADMQTRIRQKIDSPNNRFFLYEFMRALAPTLIDSIYFALYDGYQNKVTKAVCDMCGYLDAPTGLSLSNLKTIDMPSDSSCAYDFCELYFVSPYMPNSRGTVSVSTFQNKMTLSLHTEQNDKTATEIARFESAIARLTE